MASKTEKTKTIPSEETALFCDQVAMIVRSGIPLRNGIETLCNSYKNSKYADKFMLINEEVQKGGSLYSAIKLAGFFPAYMVNMIRVGEYTGTIDDVMESLANYYHRDADIKSSIPNPILYPSLLALMMAAVIAVLTIFVMPVFERVFANLGGDATTATATAMNIGSVIGKVVLIFVGVMLLIIVILVILMATKQRSKVMDFLSKIFPPLRRINETISAARFASISEIMIKSGYNIDATVDLSLGVIQDRGSIRKLKKLKKSLDEGNSFANGVARMGMYDGVHANMIEMGNNVGQLDNVMHKIAGMYDARADESINRIVSLIEPTLVAILSAVVGGILLAVMLPLVGILSSMT